MNEVIERVAKAIRNNGSVRYGPDWDNIPDDAKEMFRQDARAAIFAMRKPTEEMIDAGLRSIDMGCDINDRECLVLWTAMIDEALK